ncbi:MAG: protein translocase subunit SecD [Lachnospiraceae bacterium]|nr:protein translocase subunit SecD [Lachnospiraceae bacterium]
MKASKKNVFIFLIVTVLLILLATFGIGNQVKGVPDIRFGIDIRGGVEAVFKPETTEKVEESDLESARSIIETRLDNQNITDREITIDKEGGYIIVRFPWKSDETDYDPESAIAELGEMARLTFQDPQHNIMVEDKNVSAVKPAAQNQNGYNEYVVELTFDSEGAAKFEEATGNLIGQQMGIYMDDVLISNPVVQTRISGGNAVITGMEDYDAARALANKINAGALPFALETRSFSTISPSLGQNALRVMIDAGIIAFALVCLFMLFVYKLPGFVACLTLLFQMLLQLLAISIPQYTLTLPGIAGIILSLGMAVDANVIISERISEEIAKGETVKSAVRRGYSKAFTSVLDGNITTAIVAIVLMIFGSGTMLSFGYTLLVGVIVNCFVGVNVSRFVLQSLLEYGPCNKEKNFREKKERQSFQFFEKKKIFAVVSGVVFVLGIIAIFVRGIKLDTQFTGGTVLEYSLSANQVDTEAVASAIQTAVNRNATVQLSTSQAGTTLVATMAGNNGLTPEEQKGVSTAIGNTINVNGLEPSQTFAVEPYVGAKAMRNAGIAVVLAFVCILIYIGIRFSTLSGLSAGLTAIIALLHDVCIVLFAFTAFGISLGDSFVAVVLTIIGYSINDTIVVYDRIRENKNMHPKLTLPELVDLSVTQVFSRSVNTSVTTLLCVLVILIASVMYRISSIYNFSLPMTFGLLAGCYSSICIAAALWAGWKGRNKA